MTSFTHLARGIFCLFLVFSSRSLHAQIFALSLEDRIAEAEHIVIARVTDQESYWDSGQKNIYTSNTLEIQAYLKGYAPQTNVVLISEGGMIDNKMESVSPSLQLTPGQRYLFLLEADNHKIDNKQYRQVHSETIQARAVACVQGALPYHSGTFRDLLTEPPLSESALLLRVQAQTHVPARTARQAVLHLPSESIHLAKASRYPGYHYLTPKRSREHNHYFPGRNTRYKPGNDHQWKWIWEHAGCNKIC
ncbi:MAG: hypothetical protein R2792_12590 [Saprospiraceae bacterium]